MHFIQLSVILQLFCTNKQKKGEYPRKTNTELYVAMMVERFKKLKNSKSLSFLLERKKNLKLIYSGL